MCLHTERTAPMLITSLKQQKKNPERLNLYLDGEFYCGLNAETAAVYRLKEGQEIDKDLLEELTARDRYDSAMSAALMYAARTGGKSRFDFEQKLTEYDEATQRAVLARMEELGYINDALLAKETVSRALAKGEGRYMIKQRLLSKHLDEETVRDAMEEISPEEETAAAVLALKNAAARCRDTEPKKRRARIYAALVRKGFPYDIVSAVTEQDHED